MMITTQYKIRAKSSHRRTPILLQATVASPPSRGILRESSWSNCVATQRTRVPGATSEKRGKSYRESRLFLLKVVWLQTSCCIEASSNEADMMCGDRQCEGSKAGTSLAIYILVPSDCYGTLRSVPLRCPRRSTFGLSGLDECWTVFDHTLQSLRRRLGHSCTKAG